MALGSVSQSLHYIDQPGLISTLRPEVAIPKDRIPIGVVSADPKPRRMVFATFDRSASMMILTPLPYSVEFIEIKHRPESDKDWRTNSVIPCTSKESLMERVTILKSLRDRSYEDILIHVFDSITIRSPETSRNWGWQNGLDMVRNFKIGHAFTALAIEITRAIPLGSYVSTVIAMGKVIGLHEADELDSMIKEWDKDNDSDGTKLRAMAKFSDEIENHIMWKLRNVLITRKMYVKENRDSKLEAISNAWKELEEG